MNKICIKCNIEQDLSNFQKRKNSKDGFRNSCKICVKKYQKNYQKEYYSKNNEVIKSNKKIYRSSSEYKKRRRTLNTRFDSIIRVMLRRCFKHKGIRRNTTIDIIGYDTNKLKQRLECQFKDGMTWENYGKWHIDHKKPISKFDKNVKISTINGLCNLQPLWASDNLTKGCKF
jgi:hypothetical protein